MNMRLLGAPTMADVVPSMVDTSALRSPDLGPTMYHENCELHSEPESTRLADVAADERMMPVGVKARL